MAFILKSSKFMCTLWGSAREANLSRLHNVTYDLLLRSLPATNVASFRKFSLQKVKVTSPDLLSKAIYQLQIDVSNTKRIFLRDVEDILETIKDIRTINYHESVIFLKCCGSSLLALNFTERQELIQRVLNLLENIGTQVDIKHYNVLLNIYVENDFTFSPSQFLETLQKKNLVPTSITYQHLLKAYCQQGDISKASELLEVMKNNDMNLNEDIFNSLILGHCQINDIEGAKGILNLMKAKGINPTSESYINFLCGYAKIGELSKIKSVMNECKNKMINFSSKDIFKLVYELAINDHFKFIDEILDNVKNIYKYTPEVHLFINKLLEKKYDSVALQVYKSVLKNNVISASTSHGNYLIEFFVKYRSNKEILSFCKELEKHDFTFPPLACALKQVLLLNDIQRAIDFFTAMKEEKLPVRPHYFWPLIVNASKEGNESILNILMKMKQMGVVCCTTTSLRVLYSYYKFGTDWHNDIEKLNNAGVLKEHIGRNLLKFLISSNNAEDVEKLTAQMPITVNSNIHMRLLMGFMENCNNADLIVNVMYNLIHDFRVISTHSFKTESPSDAEEGEGKIESANHLIKLFFDCLMDHEKIDLLKQVLQKMHEKNIGISPALSAEIREKLNSDEVNSLLDKMTNEKLLEEFDENLLALKLRDKIEAGNFYDRKILGSSDFQRACNDISKLVKAGFIDNAMKQCRNFLFEFADYEFRIQDSKAFKIFLMSLSNNADYKTVEEAFKIGNKMGILSNRNFYPLVHTCIVSGDLEKATNVYCENALLSKCSSSWSHLVTKLIESENATLLQKVTNTVSKIRSENFSMGVLLSQLANLEKVKEIVELAESSDCLLTTECFDFCCSWLLKNDSPKGLETLLTATETVGSIFRPIIYDYLLNAYMKAGNATKVDETLSRLNEEKIDLKQSLLMNVNSFLRRKNFRDHRNDIPKEKNRQTSIEAIIEKSNQTGEEI